MYSASPSSSATRAICIIHEEQSLNINIKNNVISKFTVKDYFTEDAILTYLENGVYYRLESNDKSIQMKSDVDVYYVKNAKETLRSSRIESKRSNRIIFETIEKYFKKNYSYKVIIQKLQKKYNITIALRTLSRILQENNLKRKNINESPRMEIAIAIFLEMQGSGFNLGYRAMWQRLKKVYNLQVKQRTVMELLKQIDPEGVDDRSRYKLKRRVYTVPGPNFIWHADGHDKLKRYGFAIYGFIDGFSRKIVSLEVASSNNNPKVIAYYYLQTIKKFGFLPTLLRTDHGTEVSLMEPLHMALRYNHTDECAGINSFLKGKSTHNQRIESYWRQFRQHMGDFYINLFKKMESMNILDICNPIHIDALRYCFGYLIQEEILITKKEWNEHRVRKQNVANVLGGIPNELFHCPENVGATNYKKSLTVGLIERVFEKYTSKPTLFSSRFEEALNSIGINKKASNAEEAYNLYLTIMSTIDKL